MYNSKEFENLSKKLSKRESLSFKQLWKVYVLLIIRPRTDNEYREYGPVRLYISKMHPDGSSRCPTQMLHLGVVRFFISSMHPDESSKCNYVRLIFIF